MVDLAASQQAYILETAVRQAIQLLQLGDDAAGVAPILTEALETLERIR